MRFRDKVYSGVGKTIHPLFPKNTIVPILSGPLRGTRWLVASGNIEYFLGSYEKEKMRLFDKEIKKGIVVYDIGAHVGYYTLLASKKVCKNGHVISFEPLQRNLRFLKAHLLLNKADNVNVIEAAVSNYSGTAFFKMGPSSYEGKMSSIGENRVATVWIDELISRKIIPIPDVVKIDVEGAEVSVLEGSIDIIANYSPKLFLATHGKENRDRCFDFLKRHNYKLLLLNNMAHEVLAVNSRNP